MEGSSAQQFEDVMVRVPAGTDIKPLARFVDSMGWTVIVPDNVGRDDNMPDGWETVEKQSIEVAIQQINAGQYRPMEEVIDELKALVG